VSADLSMTGRLRPAMILTFTLPGIALLFDRRFLCESGADAYTTGAHIGHRPVVCGHGFARIQVLYLPPAAIDDDPGINKPVHIFTGFRVHLFTFFCELNRFVKSQIGYCLGCFECVWRISRLLLSVGWRHLYFSFYDSLYDAVICKT